MAVFIFVNRFVNYQIYRLTARLQYSSEMLQNDVVRLHVNKN